jgi:hypothetical protein
MRDVLATDVLPILRGEPDIDVDFDLRFLSSEGTHENHNTRVLGPYCAERLPLT